MRFVIFCHSLASDWNHGNAHFLRGVVTELLTRGHDVKVYEPVDAWSAVNLEQQVGVHALRGYRAAYPALESIRYDRAALDLDAVLRRADVVLVHEWNDPELVAGIGQHRSQRGDYRLLFHDTHHRAVTAAEEMARYDLSHYDGVLAFGAVIADAYRRNGWAERAWVWHEAADVRVFGPRANLAKSGEVVWIGNWGDGERTAELEEFLIEPVRRLRIRGAVYGVRYTPEALASLKRAGIEYRGWLPNYRVPEIYGRYALTVHVPRRPYARLLSGVPTIRVFEALACVIPLVSAPWTDSEHLFTPGRDFLLARDGGEMRAHIQSLLADRRRAAALSRHGLETIRARHTCAHRVDELLAILEQIGRDSSPGSRAA